MTPPSMSRTGFTPTMQCTCNGLAKDPDTLDFRPYSRVYTCMKQSTLRDMPCHLPRPFSTVRGTHTHTLSLSSIRVSLGSKTTLCHAPSDKLPGFQKGFHQASKRNGPQEGQSASCSALIVASFKQSSPALPLPPPPSQIPSVVCLFLIM